MFHCSYSGILHVLISGLLLGSFDTGFATGAAFTGAAGPRGLAAPPLGGGGGGPLPRPLVVGGGGGGPLPLPEGAVGGVTLGDKLWGGDLASGSGCAIFGTGGARLCFFGALTGALGTGGAVFGGALTTGSVLASTGAF